MSIFDKKKENSISGDFPMYDKLKLDVQRLKSSDKRFEIFGTTFHKYEFNPTLTEDYILKFEENHKIHLPNDYKAFLKEVGNGGAGPHYGMYKLENYYQPRFYDGSDANYVGDNFLQTPFPYTKSNPFIEDDIDEVISGEEYAKEFIKNISGAITLAHQGCGYFDMLIVSGEEKGKVWVDATVSDYGMYCAFNSFTEWYLNWINVNLEN